jgi:hypothetical protein
MVRSVGRFVIGLVNRIRLQCYEDVLHVVSCHMAQHNVPVQQFFKACSTAAAVLHVNVGVTLQALNVVQQFDRDCVSVNGACVYDLRSYTYCFHAGRPRQRRQDDSSLQALPGTDSRDGSNNRQQCGDRQGTQYEL